jgi:two-component system, LytTR family, sensor kinase
MIVLDGATFYFVRKAFSIDLFASFTRGLSQTLLLYSAVVMGVLALDHARLARVRLLQAAHLESDLTRARLETLRRQIQPHFLFNTLNTVAALIDTDPARAGLMVVRLGDLLRRSLHDQERLWISLADELDFLRLYTEIEQVRFEGWLNVREDVDHAVLQACVPPMILQPLVENAIKHGIAPLKRKGTILIRAGRDRDKLRVVVADDGAGLHGNGGIRFGIGLQTTTQRLTHLFGIEAHVDLAPRTGGGTTVSITLPLITSESAAARVLAAPGNSLTYSRQ